MTGHFSTRRLRNWRLVALTSLLAIALSAGPAWGWGRLGHRLCGRIADDRLSPHAKEAIKALLDPGETLADISSWADDYRSSHRETSTWHYVNTPITEAKYDPKFEAKEGGVVSKVDDFRRILADTKLPREERQKALKFLAHFLEDMHQPVHVGHRGDKGGNELQVQFFGNGSNLHSVWDTGLIAHDKKSENDYVALLEGRITPELAASWSKEGTVDWANESLEAAKLAYKTPGTGVELKSGAKLDQAYLDANLPTAERRVMQAGVRLAYVLNQIFP